MENITFIEPLLFYIFGSAALISALLVVTRANPLMSALWLIVCLSVSAGMFALLAAPFLAVIQILVYAGAVMVLFVFVVMLIAGGADAVKARFVRFGKVVGMIAGLYFLTVVAIALWRGPFLAGPALPQDFLDTKVLSRMLLTQFVVPFELVSILLLAAMVGAVVMGKKKL